MPLVGTLWWVGCLLSGLGLLLLACTTIFDLKILPKRLRPHVFWLGVGVLIMGLSLSVVFT